MFCKDNQSTEFGSEDFSDKGGVIPKLSDIAFVSCVKQHRAGAGGREVFGAQELIIHKISLLKSPTHLEVKVVDLLGIVQSVVRKCGRVGLWPFPLFMAKSLRISQGECK